MSKFSVRCSEILLWVSPECFQRQMFQACLMTLIHCFKLAPSSAWNLQNESRGRCVENTLGTTNYSSPFVFHEELFCFESRIIELAASQNTCWMVQTYYRWPEAQTINNFVPFSMRKMFRKFGTHSSKFRDVVNVRNPFSHSNIPWHPAS